MKKEILKILSNKSSTLATDFALKNVSQQSCRIIRTLTSSTQAKEKNLKLLEDIPGPPNTPFLGNVLGLKNPEHGRNPRHILKSGRHLWEIYGDMWRLDVPGKYPIIW